MKKIELERMLMDPEGLKKLSERAAMIKQKYGEGSGRPAFKIQAAQPLTHQVQPTPDEIRANDLDHVERRNLLANIGRFLPELAKETPKSALELLTRRCREKPSIAAQLLVEDAINRLISHGKLDSQTEKVIDEAIEMLGSVVESTRETGKVGSEPGQDRVWTRLYRHSDYDGASYYVSLPAGWVYRKVHRSLADADLNDRISSLYVDASSTEVGGRVILFQHRYKGRYAIFPTTPGAPDERVWTPYVGDYINDRTSSILVVRQYENELPFALGSTGLRDTIEDMVGDQRDIEPRGDPIITWDMWPNFEPDRRYVYLRIPVEVEVPNWWNYDAEIRLWIYIFVDFRGTLRGYVARYGAWVEGGVKTIGVLNEILARVHNMLPDIQERIGDNLSAAAFFEPFERQYFLPGTAGSTGHTEDDVTLVLVRS